MFQITNQYNIVWHIEWQQKSGDVNPGLINHGLLIGGYSKGTLNHGLSINQ
jgi:hypothetical protein